ncbi:MAG: aminoacyl-tRNA deacylase [Actinomycetota bacterium]
MEVITVSIVEEYLNEQGVRYQEIEHPRVETSMEEAHIVGVAPGMVAKTLVLTTARGHILVVVPASRQLDVRMARKAIGDPHARLATEVEIREAFPGYELGAIPPLGTLIDVPTFIDTELAAEKEIVFADGRQTESVRMRTADLLAVEHTVVVPLTRSPNPFDQDWME